MKTSRNILTTWIIISGLCSFMCSFMCAKAGYGKNIVDNQTGQIIHSISSTSKDLTIGDLKLNSKINIKNLLACKSVSLKTAKVNYVCLSTFTLPNYISESVYMDATQHKNTALVLYSANNIHNLRAKWIYIQLDKKFFKNVVSHLQKEFGKENLSYPLKVSDPILHYKPSKTYLWRTKNTTNHQSTELELNEINNPYNRTPNFKTSKLTLRYPTTPNPFTTLPIEYLQFNIHQSKIPHQLTSLK